MAVVAVRNLGVWLGVQTVKLWFLSLNLSFSCQTKPRRGRPENTHMNCLFVREQSCGLFWKLPFRYEDSQGKVWHCARPLRPSENKIKKRFFLNCNNKVNSYFMSKKTAQSLHSSLKATVCVIWESTAQGKGCSFSFLHIQKNVQSQIYLFFIELPCMGQKLLMVVELLKNMWSHKNKCKSQMTWNISLLPPHPPPLSL